ncbi:SULTR2, partial [Symbiodinium necroappetens]
APTPNNCKIQPQLQNLPRFQPPDFEGEDGQLPRPDSPCSTPRESGHSDQLEDCGPFSPDTFVEYRSRSSGQWILAKVENFNADTQTYRLDVQPYAPADRVRARRRGLPKRQQLLGKCGRIRVIRDSRSAERAASLASCASETCHTSLCRPELANGQEPVAA